MVTGSLAIAFLAWLLSGEGGRSRAPHAGPEAAMAATPAPETSAGAEAPSPEEELRALRSRNGELTARLRALAPRGAYVVVDRGNNRIYLRRGDSVLVDAPASTGSRAVLKEIGGKERSWTFDTPAGRFSVLSERTDPVWTKPDWAFLEEGEPIPSRLEDRKEYGSLGEYALDLGDGYMIHGTLYERLLGRSVTHGCVRVGREPLRAIAAGTRAGSQVFIF